jgi:MFS family permease
VLSISPTFSATAVLPQLKLEWGVSSSTGSWLTIALQLGFVVGALLSSIVNLPDLISAARVMFVSSVGMALVNGLLAGVDTVGPAIALRFATGLFAAGIYPPGFKLMATWFQRGRGMALGVLAGAIAVATALPHLINGLGGLDWRAVVLVTSALTLMGGWIAGFLVGEGPFPFPQATFDPRQARRTLANRGVRLASFGYFGHMWELFAMWAWFHVFFATVGGVGPRTSAFATFAVIGVGGLGCIAGGILGDRWGRTRTTAAAMSISATCALIIGFLADASPMVVLVIGLVWGATVIADSAQFSTMVTELADQAYVGTALTIQLALGFTITVATIWLIPIVEAAHGWGWAFALLAPGPILGTVAMLRLKSLPEAARIAGGRG